MSRLREIEKSVSAGMIAEGRRELDYWMKAENVDVARVYAVMEYYRERQLNLLSPPTSKPATR